MATSSEGKHARLVWILTLGFAVAGILAALALIIAEVYVRWSVNQNFSFLGGNALPALIVSSFGTLLGLSYISQSRN